MRGLGCLISIVLMLVSFIALALFAILPSIPAFEENAALTNLYTSLFCETGETLERDTIVSRYGSETNYSMQMDCINNDGVQRSVTDKAILYGIGGFIIPFLIGLFLGIWLITVLAKKRVSSLVYPNQAGKISVSGVTIDLNDPNNPIQWNNATPQNRGGGIASFSDTKERGGVWVGFSDSSAGTTSPTGTQREDYSHKLRELQETYDQGLITREEFDRLRHQILDRMGK